MIIVLVEYFCKDNCREDFLRALKEQKIDAMCQAEAGNLKYDYSLSADRENVLILNEIWKDAEALNLHGSMPHMKLIPAIKEKDVEKTEIRKFEAAEL